MNIKEWVTKNTIHRIYAGSRLYGTDRPDSDWDERGVCRMPPQALLGLTRFDQYQRHNDEEDTCIYGLTKFFKLSLDANPNIFDILFAPPDVWLVDSTAWAQIYTSRDLFLSQKMRYTFSGYAVAQLKRIKSHRRWLLDPPERKPSLEEFGGWLETGDKGGQKIKFANDVKRGQWEKAKNNWAAYDNWRKNRNPARAELERKYGYDVKHAAHLVRLMAQADNILENCDYDPRLTGNDKEQVLGVLAGEWEYDELIEWASMMDEIVRSRATELPKKPAFKEAEKLLIELNKGAIK